MISEDVVTHSGVPEPGSRMSRWQLAVIAAVVALAAAIGVVLGFTVLSERSNALGGAASYLPSDTVFYAEARLDLAPAQASSLHAILERFPAADAEMVLLDEIGKAIDGGLTGSGSPITYAADVKPWFDGRVGIGLLNYPLAALTAGDATVPDMAALFGVKDPVAAQAFADALHQAGESSGATFDSTQHAGVTIWASRSPNPSGMSMGEGAFAVTADQMLVANSSATIEALLDANAGSESLGTRRELQQLVGHLPADWVGFFAVDTRQIIDATRDAVAKQDPSVAAVMEPYLANVPPLAVSSFSLKDDALVMDAAASLPGGDLAPQNSRRDLAAQVPGDALFFADGGNVGSGLAQLVTAMRAGIAAQPGGEDAKQMLQQSEAALGADLEDFVRWIDSGALAVGWSGDAPYGGLVLKAADAGAATARVNQLRALLDLAVSQSGVQIKVTTDTVAGVEVTTVDFAAALGGPGATTGMPEAKVQYAIRDDTVLIGVGGDFVARSLRLADGKSLAESDRFAAAVSRFGGDDNAGVVFLDLAAIRGVVEKAAGQGLPPEYASQIKPNLEPLDYLATVTRVDGDVVVSSGGLVLR
jgi:hypothetical protein